MIFILQKLTRNKNMYFLFLLTLLFSIGNSYNCDSSLLQREKIYEKSLVHLENNFQIQKGEFIFTNKSFGNPAGTYGVFKFDNLPLALKYKIQNISSFFHLNTTSTVMGKKDALVLYMCTPPIGDYFSFVNYVLVRFELPTFWLAATPLNDPINNLVMNTSTNKPYNSTVLFISTGDYKTFKEIRNSFIENGVEPHAINFLPIPSDVVKFKSNIVPWLIDQADLLNYHFRISSFDHYNQEMIEYLSTTWSYYYLKAKPSLLSDPVFSQPLRNRKSNQSQLYFQDQLLEIVTTTIEKYSKDFLVKHIFRLTHIVPDFSLCLTNSSYLPIFPNLPTWGVKSIPGFCDFFVRDSLYSLYPNIYSSNEITNDLHFYKNRTFAVFGINQVLAKQAVYSNLLLTVASHPEDPQHTSNISATSFAPNNIFFQYFWSRNCSLFGKYCQEITENQMNYTDWVFMAERKYLNPITKIGPDPEEILEPIVVVLDFHNNSRLL